MQSKTVYGDEVETVIFDLDGTLLSGDCTKIWLIHRFRTNVLRLIVVLFCLPIALSLLLFKPSRTLGASMFLWLASCMSPEQQLIADVYHFALKVKNNTLHDLHWFDLGIAEIRLHQQQGRSIVIATAAPEVLVKQLLDVMDFQVQLVGSELTYKYGGWVCTSHCRNEVKVQRLKIIGVNAPWFAAYSDDLEQDYPILVNSVQPYLINAKNKQRVKPALKNLKHLNWL